MRGVWPTHFFAIRLADEHIVQALASTQAQIVAGSPWLQPCLVPPEKAHITLAVFNAGPADAQIPNAIAALHSLSPADVPGFGPHQVRVAGLASFGDRVVYAQAHGGQGFDAFVQAVAGALHEQLVAHGIDMPPHSPPTPHVTLMKVKRGNGPRRIEPSAWASLQAAEMGATWCTSIELHPMGGLEQGAAGYYPTLARLELMGATDS
mmetsp:Transcript_21439/g.72136  ORF Transcript_21439/g.72136 Transcript_21439/m.72136 type:complete len:207 (-) Transcript_21439:219-839(-)